MVRLGLFAWNTNSTVSSWEGFHRPPPLDRIFNTKTRAPDTTQATTPGASLVMNFPGIVAALSRVNQMGVVSGEPPPPGDPPHAILPALCALSGEIKRPMQIRVRADRWRTAVWICVNSARTEKPPHPLYLEEEEAPQQHAVRRARIKGRTRSADARGRRGRESHYEARRRLLRPRREASLPNPRPR